MKQSKLHQLASALMVVSITACEKPENTQNQAVQAQLSVKESAATPRWYSAEQVVTGKPLFQTNCASCHKPDASGAQDWKQNDANGNYPPPPLNGSAHTWHHALSVLQRTVKLGGVPLGGTMPGFESQLDDAQIDSILAWIQSQWSDEIYDTWSRIDAQSR